MVINLKFQSNLLIITCGFSQAHLEFYKSCKLSNKTLLMAAALFIRILNRRGNYNPIYTN